MRNLERITYAIGVISPSNCNLLDKSKRIDKSAASISNWPLKSHGRPGFMVLHDSGGHVIMRA